MFAHSERRFYEFRNQTNNWFDIFIVAISLFNAIMVATGSSIPNAKVSLSRSLSLALSRSLSLAL
jgi:hypothetical protein